MWNFVTIIPLVLGYGGLEDLNLGNSIHTRSNIILYYTTLFVSPEDGSDL